MSQQLSQQDDPITSAVIDGNVRDELQRLESQDSLTTGEIIAVETLKLDDPYQNVEAVNLSDTISETRGLLDRVKNSDSEQFHGCIGVWVKLDCSKVFVDLYTYEEGHANYDSINDLAMALDVDSRHIGDGNMVGKHVQISRENGRWEVVEDSELDPIDPAITWEMYAPPAIISVFSFFFSASLWVTGRVGFIAAFAGGFFISLGLFGILIYWLGVTQLDHQAPPPVSWILNPTEYEQLGNLDNSNITSVDYGEFMGIVSVIDDSERANVHKMLWNTALLVNIPPQGEMAIPLPTPANRWDNTVTKSFVYSVAPSVGELDRSRDKLVPLTVTDDDFVRVDVEELPHYPPREIQTPELIADATVRWVNQKLGVKPRHEMFELPAKENERDELLAEDL